MSNYPASNGKPEKGNNIGKYVREARLSTNPKTTQKDLAAYMQSNGLNIDDSGISKIENGTRAVTTNELEVIAAKVRKPLYWLLGYDEKGTLRVAEGD